MPRDYVKTPHPRHPNSIPGWAWLLAGLSIGLFVALLVYINGFTASTNKDAVKQAFGNIVNRTSDKVASLKNQQKQNSKKSTAHTSKKPRFDFYTILPELEVAIPDEELKPKAGIKGKTASIEPLTLQIGSFRQYTEADKLKARLALQGISATIQTVTINQGDTWHRVRVGPIRDLMMLNNTRRRLRSMGIASIVVKQKS